MLVELHILQNFAPSNLNRDDTNAPKDCEFGGYRRARISSQCIKRAIRTEFRRSQLLDEANLGKRTKRLVEEVLKRIPRRKVEEARAVVEYVVKGMGFGLKNEGRTEYLLFLAQSEMDAFAKTVTKHWDTLLAKASQADADSEKKTGKDAKKQAKAELPQEVKSALGALLGGREAVDLALFGRMLTDLRDHNVHAACQVAHAISTHKVDMDFDFYTAVDDLQPSEEAGAGMMGTVEFNSSCFYRYSNLDLQQLAENLNGDGQLVQKTVKAFLLASVHAVPTGKQNSMAAHNPPSLVLAVVRRRGLWSLANAFVKPIWPRQDMDLVHASAQALDAYWGRLTKAYGINGHLNKWVLSIDDGAGLDHLEDAQVDSLDKLVDQVDKSVHKAQKEPAS